MFDNIPGSLLGSVSTLLTWCPNWLSRLMLLLIVNWLMVKLVDRGNTPYW